MHDKVEDFRIVPLTPYVAHLMAALPRRNEFVFSTRPLQVVELLTRRLPTVRPVVLLV